MVGERLYTCGLTNSKRTVLVVMYEGAPMWVAFGKYRGSQAIFGDTPVSFGMVGLAGFLHTFRKHVKRDVSPVTAWRYKRHTFNIEFRQ